VNLDGALLWRGDRRDHRRAIEFIGIKEMALIQRILRTMAIAVMA
jgi:hypothetical protein